MKDFRNHYRQGVYCIHTALGMLYGSSHLGTRYASAVPNASVVRCIYARASRTISFNINGEDKGVAFRNVPAGQSLHAFAGMFFQGDCVKIIHVLF